MGKKTVSERYIPGDYYMECGRCGLSYRRSDLKRDGYKKDLMVCRTCWDFKPTYPSPPPDRISVPIPRPDNTSVSANATTYNYTVIGDNLFKDPYCGENLINYPNDYTKWAKYEEYGDPISVDGSGNFTIKTNSAVVFFYRDVENDTDAYYSFGGTFDISQGEATIGILTGNITVIGQKTFSSSGTYETSAEVKPGGIPSGKSEMRFVITNNETTDLIVKCTDMLGDKGFELFEEGLWSGGELSSEHVKYYDRSRKISSTTATISINNLTIGNTYRLMFSGWLSGSKLSVEINDSDIDVFKSMPKNTWNDDSYIFTAQSTTAKIDFISQGIAYIDGVYFQEYVSEDRRLTNAEILENKTPPADVNTDNTETPGPFYVEHGRTNYNSDPTISEIPLIYTEFTQNHTVSAVGSADRMVEGVRSLKVTWFSWPVYLGGAYVPITGLSASTTYIIKVFMYRTTGINRFYYGFGADGDDLLENSDVTLADEWVQPRSTTFTTPSSITNNNLYFGANAGGVIGDTVVYYDGFYVYEYINKTTPF